MMRAFLSRSCLSRLQAKLIQESFVTGILYINLTNSTEVNVKKELYGFPEIPTNASIFAELSESINLEKLSKQISELMVTATQKLNDLILINSASTFLKQTTKSNYF